jgi:hypothetical protein
VRSATKRDEPPLPRKPAPPAANENGRLRRPFIGIRFRLSGGSAEGVQSGDALHTYGALFAGEDAACHPQPGDYILRLVLENPGQDRPARPVIVCSNSLDSQLEGFGDRGDLL